MESCFSSLENLIIFNYGLTASLCVSVECTGCVRGLWVLAAYHLTLGVCIYLGVHAYVETLYSRALGAQMACFWPCSILLDIIAVQHGSGMA
jgi:hypothetical protein